MNNTNAWQRHVDNSFEGCKKKCRFQHKSSSALEREMFLTRESEKMLSNIHLPRQWTWDRLSGSLQGQQAGVLE